MTKKVPRINRRTIINRTLSELGLNRRTILSVCLPEEETDDPLYPYSELRITGVVGNSELSRVLKCVAKIQDQLKTKNKRVKLPFTSSVLCNGKRHYQKNFPELIILPKELRGTGECQDLNDKIPTAYRDSWTIVTWRFKVVSGIIVDNKWILNSCLDDQDREEFQERFPYLSTKP